MKKWYKLVGLFLAFLLMVMALIVIASFTGNTRPAEYFAGIFRAISNGFHTFEQWFNDTFYRIIGA